MTKMSILANSYTNPKKQVQIRIKLPLCKVNKIRYLNNGLIIALKNEKWHNICSFTLIKQIFREKFLRG